MYNLQRRLDNCISWSEWLGGNNAVKQPRPWRSSSFAFISNHIQNENLIRFWIFSPGKGRLYTTSLLFLSFTLTFYFLVFMTQIPLMQATQEAWDQTDVASVQEWIWQSRRFVPRCLADENKAPGTDSVLLPCPAKRWSIDLKGKQEVNIVFSSCLCGFSPGTLISSHTPKTYT